jgi:hypothetical protein
MSLPRASFNCITSFPAYPPAGRRIPSGKQYSLNFIRHHLKSKSRQTTNHAKPGIGGRIIVTRSGRSCEKPATPTGSIGTEWEVDQGVASRIVYTPDRYIDGFPAGVHISAIQFEDGSFDTDAEIPEIYVDCHPDSGLTTEQARSLALMLFESASQLEGWIEAFGDATDHSAD